MVFVAVSRTEMLLSLAFGTYKNGPCCASTSGASIAMPPNQTLASKESLSLEYEGLRRRDEGRPADPPLAEQHFVHSQASRAPSTVQPRPRGQCRNLHHGRRSRIIAPCSGMETSLAHESGQIEFALVLDRNFSAMWLSRHISMEFASLRRKTAPASWMR